jgi:excisionase family DNA binding protein
LDFWVASTCARWLTETVGGMADGADQLAAAIRQVIYDAVQSALRSQPAPEPSLPPLEPPKFFEGNQTGWPRERMLLSLLEVQHRLSLGRSTLYQLLRDGRIPCVKIGRRRFGTATALADYIESLCVPGE